MVECYGSVSWVVDVGGHGGGLVGGAYRSCGESGVVGGGVLEGHFLGASCGGKVDVVYVGLHLVVGLGYGGGVEGVGLDDVGAGFEVLLVDVAYYVGSG